MNIRFSSESVNVCREGMCSCYKLVINGVTSFLYSSFEVRKVVMLILCLKKIILERLSA